MRNYVVHLIYSSLIYFKFSALQLEPDEVVLKLIEGQDIRCQRLSKR